MSRALNANDVHQLLADRWPAVLLELGVDDSFLTGKHGPCPICGGVDRWRFTNYRQRGDWICNQCGAGNAFALLMRLNGWTFAEARRAVIDAAGIGNGNAPRAAPAKPSVTVPELAQPTRRVRDLLRTSCAPSDVLDVVRYLKSRHVFPLPRGCALRAHVGADYFEDCAPIGRYPALLAPVTDAAGDFVTLHCTYLERGAKLANRAPRKLLGKLTGRRGCAVRLAPATDVLGIAEGIETALAAMRLHRIPTWSALNAGMLAKFEPPVGVERVVIFADRDPAGLEAAWHLRDRLDITCELRVPPPPAKDWADALAVEVARHA